MYSLPCNLKVEPAMDEKTCGLVRWLRSTGRYGWKMDDLPSSGFERFGLDSWGPEGDFYGVSLPRPSSKTFTHEEIKLRDAQRNRGANAFEPASDQPSQFTFWEPSPDGGHLFLDRHAPSEGGAQVNWLCWLIEKVFIPRGHTVTGSFLSFSSRSSPAEGVLEIEVIEVRNNMVYQSNALATANWAHQRQEMETIRLVALIEATYRHKSAHTAFGPDLPPGVTTDLEFVELLQRAATTRNPTDLILIKEELEQNTKVVHYERFLSCESFHLRADLVRDVAAMLIDRRFQ
jgi:hypothetical protein